MKQRTAVYNAVINVMGEREGKYEPSDNERADIIMIVAEGLAQGTVDFSDEARAKYDSPAKIKSYTSGLVSNWLRKDTRLNGGTKYVPKNPGSRVGQGDPQLKALRQLSKTITDESKLELLNAKIEERKAEIAAEKAKKIEVDLNALPQDLRDKLGI